MTQDQVRAADNPVCTRPRPVLLTPLKPAATALRLRLIGTSEERGESYGRRQKWSRWFNSSTPTELWFSLASLELRQPLPLRRPVRLGIWGNPADLTAGSTPLQFPDAGSLTPPNTLKIYASLFTQIRYNNNKTGIRRLNGPSPRSRPDTRQGLLKIFFTGFAN